MLSRRQFLQAAGITIAAAHTASLSRLGLPSAAPSFEPLYGRALTSVPLFTAPDRTSHVVDHLWSDSITPILDTQANWYHVENGFTPREYLQPLTAPANQSAVPSTPPFWGEVTGAVAVVRAFCAADAPIVARIGQGGILRVLDYLPASTLDGVDWYGVAESDSANILGWTQASTWSQVEIDYAKPNLTLYVDPLTQRLEARDGDHAILTAPISTGRELASGVYAITDRSVSARTDHHGAVWVLDFGEGRLGGIYWHNQFGSPVRSTSEHSLAVQVTPTLAQWLFPRVTKVIVR